MQEVYIGADHAGFELKQSLKNYLLKKEYKVHDVGAKTYKKDDDYPHYAALVAKAVAKSTDKKGILICGSAQGMCIAANKIKHVRAVVPHSLSEAKLTRQHNNANVLCLSGWNLSTPEAFKMTEVWLKTSFSSEPRHTRRLKEIAKLEK
jgi:ribose 5-phosphate isomerase B